MKKILALILLMALLMGVFSIESGETVLKKTAESTNLSSETVQNLDKPWFQKTQVYGMVALPPKCSVNSHVPDFTNENKLPTSPGDYIRFVISDWRIRSYRIHIPPTYDGNTPTSLVLALHGGGGRSQTMEKKTEFSEKADEEGFIAVYPNGISRFLLHMRTWNAGHCCGIALEKNIDDVKFIRELVNKLQLQLNIDPSRIYITGHSNGAMMAYRLGTELSDVIAAIAPCAGTIGGKATEDSPLYVIPEPDYPVSVIALHGKLDENVPYDGGRGENASGSRIDLSVNESISFWVQHNECIVKHQTFRTFECLVQIYRSMI